MHTCCIQHLIIIGLFVIYCSGWCLRTKFAGKTAIQSLDFSPDGEYIVTGQLSGRVLLWNSGTLEIVKVYNFLTGVKIWDVAYSKDGKYISIAGQNDNIHIINPATFSLILSISTGHVKVYSVDFSYSNQTITTCGDDKKYKVFNITTGSLISQAATTDTPYSCQYADNNWLVVSGLTFIESYDLSNSKIYSYSGAGTFYCSAPAPGGLYAIGVSTSGPLIQCQIATANTQTLLAGSAGALYACAYAKDSSNFAVAGLDKQIYMFNATGRANYLQAILLTNSYSTLKTMKFSYDSSSLIIGDENGTVHYFKRFCSGCPVGSYPNGTSCRQCAQTLMGCSICINSSSCRSCMSGYYINTTTYLCQSCSIIQGCGNCNSSFACSLCLPGYYKNGLICTRCLSTQFACIQCSGPLVCYQCDKNAFLNGSICQKCNTALPNCLYCNSSIFCLECLVGYYENNGSCTPCSSTLNPHCLICDNSTQCIQCKNSFWINSSLLCQKCSPQCLSCNSTSVCFECISSMYTSATFTCQLCPYPCMTCTSQTFCLTCAQGNYLSVLGACTQCIFPCLSCNSSTRCQSCDVGYYLAGTSCLACSMLDLNCRSCTSSVCLDCEAQFYFNSTSSSCILCSNSISGCMICYNQTLCSQCLTGFYLQSMSGNSLCFFCGIGCSNCISSSNCSACLPGYFLLNFACSSCASNCLTCKSALSTECSQCVQGFYLSSSTYGSCLNCSAISNCVACHNTSYCVGCRVGYFLASPTSCSACTAPCTSCNSSLTDCLTCDLGYYLYTTTSGTGACGQCTYGCSECSTSATVCLSCISGYYHDSVGLQCLECRTPLPGCSVCSDSSHCIICQVGYYPVAGVCQPCSTPIPKCLKCNVLGSLCSICDYGFALSATNTSCVSCESSLPNCEQCVNSSACQTCRGGFYENGGSCVSCQTGCISCFNNTFCQVCFDSYILLSSKTCQLCEDVMVGCQICTSTTVCTNCLLGYFLNGSSCSLCRSSLEGCESCLSGSHCDYCSIYYQMQTNNTCIACSTVYSFCQTCGNSSVGCLDCEMGYFLASTGVCSSCNPASSQGCLKCTSNVTCLQCMSGYFLNTTSNACQKCDGTFSNCVYCLQLGCLSCESGFFVNNGSCNQCFQLGCQVCLGQNPLQCVTCNVRYYLTDTSYCQLCSVAIPSCMQCINSSICTFCSSGFGLNSSNKCQRCSILSQGCQLCTSSTSCLTCSTNFFLNETSLQCQPCEVTIRGCSFCLSSQICLSCQVGYYMDVDNQTCIHCSSINGCLYCLNSSQCMQCQQAYYLFQNGSEIACKSCQHVTPGCYACTNNLTCISCEGNYQLVDGKCQQIRGQVVRRRNGVQLKSYYVSQLQLKHVLYARGNQFWSGSQQGIDWPVQALFSLINLSYQQTILTILDVKLSASLKQIQFLTNNPISSELSEWLTDMPLFYPKKSRLLVQTNALAIPYSVKFMLSQASCKIILPSLSQVGDLYLLFGLSQPQFYSTFIAMRWKHKYFWIFGFTVSGLLIIIYLLRIFIIGDNKHQKQLAADQWSDIDRQLGKQINEQKQQNINKCQTNKNNESLGVPYAHFHNFSILPHVLSLKCACLSLYPTYMQYISYGYGFTLFDLPWITEPISDLFADKGQTIPSSFGIFYFNLSLVSTWFGAFVFVALVWVVLAGIAYAFDYPIQQQTKNINKYNSSSSQNRKCGNSQKIINKIRGLKSLGYFVFCFGAAFSGCLCIQGVILNNIDSVSINTLMYIVGIIIYISIIAQILYSWLTSSNTNNQQSENTKMSNKKLLFHVSKMRIVIKSSLLSFAYYSPLLVLPVIIFAQSISLAIQYKLGKQFDTSANSFFYSHSPIITLIEHILSNFALLSLFFIPDVMFGIILCSLFVVFVVGIQGWKFYNNIHEYSQAKNIKQKLRDRQQVLDESWQTNLSQQLQQNKELNSKTNLGDKVKSKTGNNNKINVMDVEFGIQEKDNRISKDEVKVELPMSLLAHSLTKNKQPKMDFNIQQLDLIFQESNNNA